MKIHKFNLSAAVFVLLVTLFVTSCSKDSASDDIVGTWTIKSATISAMVGEQSLTQYFVSAMQLPEAEALVYSSLLLAGIQQSFVGTLTIKSDGTYTDNLGGSNDNGTWSLSSDGKKLTIDPSSDDPVTVDIIELTPNSLKIKLMESMDEDLNDDGSPEEISAEVELAFTK